MKYSADYIIEKLNLKKHPEGGYYREIYRSDEKIVKDSLPLRYEGDRNFSTSIYYLLKKGEVSKLHRLKSDEIYHFYLGASVEILMIYPDEKIEKKVLGENLEKGEKPQIIIPKKVWQGLRIIGNGDFALMGTIVSPGFEFDDFELADESVVKGLLEKYSDIKYFL